MSTFAESTEPLVSAPNIEASQWVNVKDASFGDMAGKVVVVNFWSFADHHSQSLLRHLSVLNRAYKGTPFQLVGVHTPEFLFESDVANVERAVRDFRIAWPVAIDNDRENYSRFEVRFRPTCILIDPSGNVAGRFIGAGSFPDLARAIQRLLPMASVDRRLVAEMLR